MCYDLKDYYVDAGVALIFMAALFAAKKDNAVKECANEKTEKRDTSGSSVWESQIQSKKGLPVSRPFSIWYRTKKAKE